MFSTEMINNWTKNYKLTRSDASELVRLYIKYRNYTDAENYNKKFSKKVIQALEEAGVCDESDADDYDRIADICDTFHVVIGELFDFVQKYPEDTKTVKSLTDFKEIYETYLINRETTSSRKMRKCHSSCAALEWAVYNQGGFAKTDHENLNDLWEEENTCAVCEVEQKGKFCFSTVYGLEKPVCEECVDDLMKNEKESDEEEYVPDEEDDEDEDEYDEEDYSDSEAEEDEDEDDDDDYCPSGHYDSGEDEDYEEDDDEDEEDDDEDDDDEDYEEDDEDEDDEDDEDDDEDDASEAGASEAIDEEYPEDWVEREPPFEFGCTGCNYEWRDGWRQGWKAAMKQMKRYASQQRNAGIHPTECTNCGTHRGTKRCGGTCNGIVRYCSKRCQTEHWQAGHKVQCGRK